MIETKYVVGKSPPHMLSEFYTNNYKYIICVNKVFDFQGIMLTMGLYNKIT